MTNQNSLVQNLIMQASCQYKPDGKHECGRKHGQKEGGETIALYMVWHRMEKKGVVCNKCRPQIPLNRSFVPIAALSALIIEHRIDDQKTATDTSNNGGSGPKMDASPTKRNNGKGPKKPRPATAKASAAPQPKKNGSSDQQPVVAGGRWQMLVTRFGLPQEVFEAALRETMQDGNNTPFLDTLRRNPQGLAAIERWQGSKNESVTATV